MTRIFTIILVIIESVLLAYILVTNLATAYSAYTIMARARGLYQFAGTFTMNTTTVYTNSEGDIFDLPEGTAIDVDGINDSGQFMSYKPHDDDSRWLFDKKITMDMVVENESVKKKLESLRSAKEEKLSSLRLSICLAFSVYLIASLALFGILSHFLKDLWIIHAVLIVLLVVGVIFFAPVFPAR